MAYENDGNDQGEDEEYDLVNRAKDNVRLFNSNTSDYKYFAIYVVSAQFWLAFSVRIDL